MTKTEFYIAAKTILSLIIIAAWFVFSGLAFMVVAIPLLAIDFIEHRERCRARNL